MDDLQAQAMLAELEQQRTLIGNLLGTRCVELQAALSAANKRINELENPPKKKGKVTNKQGEETP